jgi:uncharacterized protein
MVGKEFRYVQSYYRGFLVLPGDIAEMTILQAFILFIAAILGGTLNSVAGGGSFIAFPALIFTGVPPINANATNTVALWPGSLASVSAYRKELAAQNRTLLFVLSSTSLVGGVLGAILLLRTPQTTFEQLIPYLLLLATLLFTFSGPMTAWLRKSKNLATARVATTPEEIPGAFNERSGDPCAAKHRRRRLPGPAPSWFALSGIALSQLVVAVYGGYFGGGIGILMLATLGLMGLENIHEMNALKTVLQSCINGVAVITFIIAGAVVWPQAILMVIGAIVGGFGGAYYARRIEQRWVRLFVICVGLGMTIYFFLRR